MVGHAVVGGELNWVDVFVLSESHVFQGDLTEIAVLFVAARFSQHCKVSV